MLPLIDEELYRDAFNQETGRPNQSIRLLTGLHILKEWFDLTDEEVLEQLEFSVQWQYALNVTAEQAHLPRRTLHNHRVRTLQSERAMLMFERITQGLKELDGLSMSRQRVDSTHIISNIAVLTRLGLMVETVTKFLRELQQEYPEKLAGLESIFSKRYLEREGYFADVKKKQARRRLPVVARDLHELVVAFAADKQVQVLDSYGLVVRLFEEQCEVVPADEDDGDDEDGGESAGGPKVRLKEGKKISGDSLQSPHDPDATYGHKGKGYEAQISETCVPENPYQVITHVNVNGAHESDQHATPAVIDGLYESGMAPDELLADTGYGSGENIVDAAVNGVDLQVRVQDPNAPARRDTFIEPGSFATAVEQPTAESDQPAATADQSTAETNQPATTDEPIGIGDFRYNSTFNEVESCPAGHAPLSNEVDDQRRKPYRATFDGCLCSGCPLQGRCPTRQPRGNEHCVLDWRDAKAATATRQREQRGAEFKDRYRLRSGIESTNEELKGGHGANDIRVRGRERVKLVLFFKAMAVNAKRSGRAALAALAAPEALAASV